MASELAELEARLAALESAPQDAGNGGTRARVDALMDLAWALRMVERQRANALASEARELSVALGYALGQARAARVLAMTISSERGLGEVFALAEEARTQFDNAGDRAGSAAARDFLASMFEYVGDYATGMELAQEALRIAREIDDPVRQGFALSNVGGILAVTGEVPRAFDSLREALTLFERARNSEGIQRICSRLTALCRDSGDTEAALGYARRLLELAEQRGDHTDRATALAALGDVALDQGDREDAERLFRESLAAYPEEQTVAVLGVATQVKLGRLLAERGAYTEAEAELQRALERVLWVGLSPADEARVRLALAEVAERQGDLPRVVSQLRDVIRVNERVAQREMRDKVTQLEMRAELTAARNAAEFHRLRFVELQEMQSKLVAAEKMAQLGALAAGTAHELNSPLGVLRSNLDVHERAALRLQRALTTLDGAAREQADQVFSTLATCTRTSAEAVARIAEVAAGYKRFTQLDLAEKRVFDVVEGLASAVTLLRPNVPERISFELCFAPVPPVEGWPGQLNQAFMTVLLNATGAIDELGTVTVRTTSRAGAVVVEIADTGRGMSEHEVEQLFEVGFAADGKRTKMRFGLSAARAAVLRHGGTIEVESAPGQGTTFAFVLPAHSVPGTAVD